MNIILELVLLALGAILLFGGLLSDGKVGIFNKRFAFFMGTILLIGAMYLRN